MVDVKFARDLYVLLKVGREITAGQVVWSVPPAEAARHHWTTAGRHRTPDVRSRTAPDEHPGRFEWAWHQWEMRMIQVTERAAIALQKVLAINNTPPKRGVRLISTNEGGLAMTIDSPRQGDAVVQRDDTPVLMVDRQVDESLVGLVLDLQPAEAEPQRPPRFTLRQQ